MRIINLIGVSTFFYPVIRYNSYRGFIVLVNGLLYHSNENNSLLFFNDLITNSSMIAYTLYFCPTIYPLTILGGFMYFLNNLFYSNNYYTQNFSDICYVLFVQIPGVYLVTSTM